MVKTSTLIFVSIFVLYNITLVKSQLEGVRDFIQLNIAGLPLLHKETYWPFDPDVGYKRKKQWEEINGIKGSKLIERLGLGIDGKEDERLAKQRQRDEGHLGGLNYFRP